MSHYLRMVYFVVGSIANAIQVLVFFRVGTDVFAMGAAGGQYAGPFSPIMGFVESAWMVEIAILQLGLTLYLIYGPVREERARAQVARP